MHMLKRHELVTKAEFCIQHSHLIDYSETRPMPSWTWDEFKRLMAKGERVSFDCSTFVTLLYKWCGLEDPNGLNYNGTGYTGTLYDHLGKHYDNPDEAHAGALLIYGKGETTIHVCMVLAHDKTNPSMASHGQAFTCGPIRLLDEDKYHPGQWRRFLDVSDVKAL